MSSDKKEADNDLKKNKSKYVRKRKKRNQSIKVLSPKKQRLQSLDDHKIDEITSKSLICINGQKAMFEISLLKKLNYFENRFSDLWMNYQNKDNGFQCKFKDVPFNMNHFKLLIIFISFHNKLNNSSKITSKIAIKSIFDLEGFIICCDYFSLNQLTINMITQWFDKCDDGDLAKKVRVKQNWKNSKYLLLSKFHQHIEYKLSEIHGIGGLWFNLSTI